MTALRPKLVRPAFALVAIVAFASLAHTLRAQVGRAPGMLDPNLATEAELAAAPNMTADLAKSVVAKRPWLSMLALDSLLGESLARDKRTELYRKVFLHINLNTTTREEILLIPGSGPRTAREFLEYRPYKALAVFRREMGKYWDAAEVARLEGYVFVPVALNTASDEDILSIPGMGPRMLREFKEYRPYDAIERFRREIGKYVPAKEVARFERYVTVAP